ncbi:MAG TPA: 50S ribosomal protein L25 [Candidatus Paceibacterota bacterium]|nr:50S ribosomal protein L25 [Candidatus Pacearchaeota archaeon]HRR95057.1 50S ribosomal protein L25 [Candidatus Paceibacterota bacterium]
MISLKAKNRTGKKVEPGEIPAILYGPGLENVKLAINLKDFVKVYNEVGEALIDLDVEGKKYSVMIYDTEQDPLTLDYIHIDFYQPNLLEEVETEVELEIKGEAPAVKNLGGTLITNLKEVSIKALPKDIPASLEVDVSGLNTFEDHILIRDIKTPAGVKILNDPEETVVQVTEPEKVEEELAKPIEGKIEEPITTVAGENKEEPEKTENNK